jgi:hypothetical protein
MPSKVFSASAYFCQPLPVALTSRLEGSMDEQPVTSVAKRAIEQARTTPAQYPVPGGRGILLPEYSLVANP